MASIGIIVVLYIILAVAIHYVTRSSEKGLAIFKLFIYFLMSVLTLDKMLSNHQENTVLNVFVLLSSILEAQSNIRMLFAKDKSNHL